MLHRNNEKDADRLIMRKSNHIAVREKEEADWGLPTRLEFVISIHTERHMARATRYWPVLYTGCRTGNGTPNYEGGSIARVFRATAVNIGPTFRFITAKCLFYPSNVVWHGARASVNIRLNRSIKFHSFFVALGLTATLHSTFYLRFEHGS